MRKLLDWLRYQQNGHYHFLLFLINCFFFRQLRKETENVLGIASSLSPFQSRWTLPFFVISDKLFDDYVEKSEFETEINLPRSANPSDRAFDLTII